MLHVDLKLFKTKLQGKIYSGDTVSIRIIGVFLRPFDSVIPPLEIFLKVLRLSKKHLAKKMTCKQILTI